MLQDDMNAQGTFMGIMSDLMTCFIGKFVLVYIDNILILSNKTEDHWRQIAADCNKIKEAQFYASRKISKLFALIIEVLGHIINNVSLKQDPERIAKFDPWTTPISKRQLQEFLGVVNYVSKFLLDIGTLIVPLTLEQENLSG